MTNVFDKFDAVLLPYEITRRSNRIVGSDNVADVLLPYEITRRSNANLTGNRVH